MVNIPVLESHPAGGAKLTDVLPPAYSYLIGLSREWPPGLLIEPCHYFDSGAKVSIGLCSIHSNY
jgi:hypothetical protein